MRSVAPLSKLLCFNSMMEEGKKMIRFFSNTARSERCPRAWIFSKSRGARSILSLSEMERLKNLSHIQSAKKAKWTQSKYTWFEAFIYLAHGIEQPIFRIPNILFVYVFIDVLLIFLSNTLERVIDGAADCWSYFWSSKK